MVNLVGGNSMRKEGVKVCFGKSLGKRSRRGDWRLKKMTYFEE